SCPKRIRKTCHRFRRLHGLWRRQRARGKEQKAKSKGPATCWCARLFAICSRPFAWSYLWLGLSHAFGLVLKRWNRRNLWLFLVGSRGNLRTDFLGMPLLPSVFV